MFSNLADMIPICKRLTLFCVGLLFITYALFKALISKNISDY